MIAAIGLTGANLLGFLPLRRTQPPASQPTPVVSPTPNATSSPTTLPPPTPSLEEQARERERQELQRTRRATVPGPLNSWKTYQNREYNFRLRHPTEFFILPTDEITGENPWRRGLLRISNSPTPEKDEFALVISISVSNQKPQTWWTYSDIEEELRLTQLKKQLATEEIFVDFLGNPPYGGYQVKILLPNFPNLYLDLDLRRHHENREADITFFKQILTTLETP